MSTDHGATTLLLERLLDGLEAVHERQREVELAQAALNHDLATLRLNVEPLVIAFANGSSPGILTRLSALEESHRERKAVKAEDRKGRWAVSVAIIGGAAGMATAILNTIKEAIR